MSVTVDAGGEYRKGLKINFVRIAKPSPSIILEVGMSRFLVLFFFRCRAGREVISSY